MVLRWASSMLNIGKGAENREEGDRSINYSYAACNLKIPSFTVYLRICPSN
jgi:hypothetical protein